MNIKTTLIVAAAGAATMAATPAMANLPPKPPSNHPDCKTVTKVVKSPKPRASCL